MSYNYTLKYRTFDQLIAAAKSDFRKYDLNDEISDIDLVKVAQRVNYDLGLRINQTKEIVLEVEKGRVRLPNNFYTLNFMFMCGSYNRHILLSFCCAGRHNDNTCCGDRTENTIKSFYCHNYQHSCIYHGIDKPVKDR